MDRVLRGEIVVANLEPVEGSEQGGKRPVLVVANNILSRYSPITIIAPITSKIYQKNYPTNVIIKKEDSILARDSTILLNQIRTVDKKRLLNLKEIYRV